MSDQARFAGGFRYSLPHGYDGPNPQYSAGVGPAKHPAQNVPPLWATSEDVNCPSSPYAPSGTGPPQTPGGLASPSHAREYHPTETSPIYSAYGPNYALYGPPPSNNSFARPPSPPNAFIGEPFGRAPYANATYRQDHRPPAASYDVHGYPVQRLPYAQQSLYTVSTVTQTLPPPSHTIVQQSATYAFPAPFPPPPPPPLPPRPTPTQQQQHWPQSTSARPSLPPRPPTSCICFGNPLEVRGSPVQLQPSYQYSQCNRRKKAVCIGINYVGQEGVLKGAASDARRFAQFLCDRFEYKKQDIRILTDDWNGSSPTFFNIITAMEWLVNDAKTHDSLTFFFAGHGDRVKDNDGEEVDGWDEAIVPLDWKTAGYIVDDLIHHIMVKPLPPGCRLTAVFDSCHSGSALDLPYIVSVTALRYLPVSPRKPRPQYNPDGTQINTPDLVEEAYNGYLGDVFSTRRREARAEAYRADQKSKRTKASPADCISFSSCADDQQSFDGVRNGEYTGLMSAAFIESFKENPHLSFQELLQSLRRHLWKEGQTPQLSSSHPMDISLRFIA
ncbi:hypothetical protein FA95DRAFT_1606608 [Auriscalpium vulgare]|uniref:Uncharacterized protein n=1 Tax=Auriscalpium vulgare TaxID=40419 RepID=A0ACB8RRK4_9AGAM|nr:hypothetical protein FA95DRAFT_1606608 [Auriscalpium vulgare]